MAGRITDDHVIALEEGQNVSHLFPNVRLGFIVSELNGVRIEMLMLIIHYLRLG